MQGKVPMFKLKPNWGMIYGAVFVLILGFLIFWNGQSDPGNISAQSSSRFALFVSIVIAGLLFIAATGRMWFRHLWHDRYDRKGRMRR